MTREHKAVLTGLGMLVAVKVAIAAGVVYSSRYYKKAMAAAAQ